MKEEFLHTTDTLWNNEVQANLFVSRILIYTAIIARQDGDIHAEG